MVKPLWQPSEERIRSANMTKFIDFVNRKHGLKMDSYFQLCEWSVTQILDFWASVWEFAGVRASGGYEVVADDLSKFPGAKWFIGARLNFAQNLLRHQDDRPALIFRGERRSPAAISYEELHNRVGRLAKSLREIGVVQGDRVAGYMPNLMETVIAMLASTSIGAAWASCGAELGPQAVLDRLGQIDPKILFTADGYWYKGATCNILSNVEKVAGRIPSLQRVIVASYVTETPDLRSIPNAVKFDDFLSPEEQPTIEFEQLPFDHPVYIMFSSGTTGKPKCMVQGPGVLVNHLKELVLHSDLKNHDRIMYITSPSWMMWHWTVSSLAVGATVVLYDGNPNYPDPYAMWKLVEDEGVTIFGCSASYINHLRSQNTRPGERHDLSSLREISQTGSPLSIEGFEWVYREIKQDLHFNSISGGTDINGCFAIGSPTLPVYAGQLQAPGLGMKVKAYDEKGRPVLDQEGELVCEAPSPSMPLYFWNDSDNQKYKEAYFAAYRSLGKNVWRHGDWIAIHSGTGGITFLGRSDATLKPSGVRIGTAEIYSIVENFEEVADSIAVGQNWRGDQRIILFVKLAPRYKLTEDIKKRIKRALREQASPRHVPALILETPDVPYTFNMKKVEIAVANIIQGKPVSNRDALTNPESLDYFEKILPELQRD